MCRCFKMPGATGRIVVFATLLFCSFAGTAYAATSIAEYALFKRSIAPSYLWGENGVMTIPKAQPVGRYNLYAAVSAQEAGTIQGEDLYNTRATITLGTSDDVEIGYTRNQIIWEDGDRTDLDADVYHIKARVLNLSDNFLPQVAVGAIGASIADNNFDSEESVLLNPFVTATLTLPLFSDDFVLSATADAEILYLDGEKTDKFFNAGLDLNLYKDFLILAAEYQGISKDDSEAILNVAVKMKLFNCINLGFGQFNLTGNKSSKSVDADDSYYQAFAGISLPLGEWFAE